MTLTRRGFIGSAIATGAMLNAPMLNAQTTPKVVVIGGGAGGATVARYLAKDSAGALDVTLVNAAPTYHTCFFSNLYIGGFRTLESLEHNFETLASDYGITVAIDMALGIDRDARTVTLAGGAVLPYDRLILSPGIDFVEGAVPGWSLADEEAMPHAYKGGTQVALLKSQIEAMPQGGTYAMVAPPNPYRCPPGPYERISMVAHLLTQINPTAKIIIADPKETFSKQGLFEDGWQRHYGGMIERLGPDFGGGEVSVDVAGKTIDVGGDVIPVDVCNVIPAQKAGAIADLAGITEGNWAPVSAFDMSSRIDPNIHVLGDAAAQGDMPKSGFSANSQAKVCANAVRGALTGSTVFPARFSNTCWSLIDTDDGVKVGASYEATEEKIASTDSFVSQIGESAELRAATYQESLGWYDAITSDMFG
jgi:NADPH-dependent 2,4-dienoyl-CoA reductase/sulfur reductase-like enzyme